MISVATIADSHFCEDSRFQECIRLHDWIVEDLERRKPDLILHAGDVFERKSTPTDRMAVVMLMMRLAQIAPVIVVRGNHDAYGDLAILSKIKAKHPIIVEEAAGVHVVAGVAVAAVAWPRKSELLASLGQQVSIEEGALIAADALRNVLRGLGDQMQAHDGPRVVLMHAMVRDSITSTGQPLVGCDMEVGVEDLGLARAHLIMLGHIHKGQDWQWGETPIIYPGSPRRTAFGEIEDKGYVFATFEHFEGELSDPAASRWHCEGWERVIVPATEMLLFEGNWDGTSLSITSKAFPHKGSTAGAEVRFRYECDSDQRDAAKTAAAELRERMLAEGAVLVKLEERVRSTTRARAPEIAAAKTLQEKLSCLWRMRGIAVMDREPRLFGRLAEIEGEPHAL